jgi:hypothetical protein
MNPHILQTPVFHPLGSAALPRLQREFNYVMARLRISVEWMFKDITQAWPYLLLPRNFRVKMQPVGMFYIVGADMTNIRTILRGGGQTAKYFNCPPPTLEEYTARREYAHDFVIVDDDPAVPPRAVVRRERQLARAAVPAERHNEEAVQDALDALAMVPAEDFNGDALVDAFGRLRVDAVMMAWQNGTIVRTASV